MLQISHNKNLGTSTITERMPPSPIPETTDRWIGWRASYVIFLLTATPCLTAPPLSIIPVIEDGMTTEVPALKDPDLWIRHDLWVETQFDSDGDGKKDRMHVGVTRPRQTETQGLKLPVIYISSPYFGRTSSNATDYFWDVRQELGGEVPARKIAPPTGYRGVRPILSKTHVKDWLPHGYIIVHSSSPGTGLSQGCPTIGEDNESLAPKAVIDWLNHRAPGYTSVEGNQQVKAYWSTGKVGMTGTSHPGTLALAAATTGVPGLEVIIPIAPNTSPYHYYRSNGLVRHPYGYLGEDIDNLYDYVHSGNEARRNYCDAVVRDGDMLTRFDRLHGDDNEFWRKRDYLLDLGPLKAAVLMSHAFNDWNVVPEHSNRIYQALKPKPVTAKIFYHQGGHGGGPPKTMMNRWFARYLHDVENEVESGPRAWIVRENDPRSEPTPYPDYPHPDRSPVTLHLVSGSPQRGQLSLERVDNSNHETFVDNVSFSGSMLAQAEWTDHRLIYVSPTLKAPLHLSGTARVTIRMASSKPAANLSVWLLSLPWNSDRNAKLTENLITRGWADPQNFRSMSESEPLTPGRFYEISFDLQPDDQIIPVEQQIGFMIFSSDRDFTLHPTPGTRLTIDPNATSIRLPVVGGAEALARSFESRSR